MAEKREFIQCSQCLSWFEQSKSKSYIECFHPPEHWFELRRGYVTYQMCSWACLSTFASSMYEINYSQDVNKAANI